MKHDNANPLGSIKRIGTIFASAALLFALLPFGAQSAKGAFPGGKGNIAFSRNGDIWVINPASGEKSRLTRTERAQEALPDWNAAGTKIAYTRCGTEEFSNCDIWVMNADGSGRTRLTSTSGPGTDPLVPIVQESWSAWSPDGTMLAYVSNAEDAFQDIWVMNADGTNQTRLTVNVGFDSFPEWSPDGSRIAFSSDRAQFDDIWVMNADGSAPVRVTRGPGIDNYPDWSPDGARIVFERDGTSENIWTINADGTEPTKLTHARGFVFEAPTFSPNGKSIAYMRHAKNGRINVWTMRADGSRRTQLTFGRMDFFPDWQPR